MVRIGIISDTHGLLRLEALAALRGCDHILHGGDIGGEAILAQLATLAPVTAVRGNNDRDGWADGLAEFRRLDVRPAASDSSSTGAMEVVPAEGGNRSRWLSIYLLHDLKQLGVRPEQEGIDIVVSGHSHRPSVERRDGVLYLNPGSAGPRRFKLPVSVAELTISADAVTPRIIEIL